jgi:hypothetical protein
MVDPDVEGLTYQPTFKDDTDPKNMQEKLPLPTMDRSSEGGFWKRIVAGHGWDEEQYEMKRAMQSRHLMMIGRCRIRFSWSTVFICIYTFSDWRYHRNRDLLECWIGEFGGRKL